MRWNLRHEEAPVDLAQRGGIPRLVQQLLAGRNLRESKEIDLFFEPSVDDTHDPLLLPDLGAAVERIDAALRREEKIFLFGDYDVDGISSLALLARYLGSLGGVLKTRLPNRLTESYGLSIQAVEEAHRWGAGLIVVADSGTTALEEIESARSRGIDVVVADHHQPGPELPKATAVVNPWRPDSRYPFPDLAAAGVVTKILEQLSSGVAGHRNRALPLVDLLDLTALGTMADSVRLEDENRLFVKHGIERLRNKARPALAALIEVCRLDPIRIRSADLSYQIIPRLNAAGRLGDADRSLELLMTDEPGRCRDLARILQRHNERRKELLEVVTREAVILAEIEQAADVGLPLVLHSPDWHPGVLGIAASRLAERFDVPTILLTSDGVVSRGSGRTARECDLLDLVRRASGPLTAFGGHRAAIGLSLELQNLERFRESVLEEGRSTPGLVGPRPRSLALDARADLEELDFDLLEWLDRFEPFGRGNPEPIVAVRGRVSGAVRVLKECHIRFDLCDGGVTRQCIGFNMSGRASLLESRSEPVHMAVSLVRNVFRGDERLQLHVKDIAIDDPFGDD